MERAGSAEHVDAVVALDGSGGYTKIADAVAAAPRRSPKRYTICVKKGVYKAGEPVFIAQDVWNLTLFGDGVDATVISGDRSDDAGYGTDQTGTLIVLGQCFIAHDLMVENTAAAVVFMWESDKSVVYCCAFKGYQDTLYAKMSSQLYQDYRVEGIVDFIFGNATAVFQKCTFLASLLLKGQQNRVTAQ